MKHSQCSMFGSWAVLGVVLIMAGWLVGCASGPPQRSTALYLGQERGCNGGVVSTEPEFMNCLTAPIGYTVRQHLEAQEPLYVGVTPGINVGVVSTKPDHNEGATRPVGYATSETYGGVKLYVGTQPGCNEGIVTAEANHQGCDTRPIGWTFPGAGAEAVRDATVAGSAATAPERDTILYLALGNQPDCQTGMVSIRPGSMEPDRMTCQAEPLGFTVKPGSAEALTPLYVGVTPGLNAGVVTTDPRHNEGQTRSIGNATTRAYGGAQLFVGVQQGCNEGVVSGTSRFNGCETKLIGWTVPGTVDPATPEPAHRNPSVSP